MRLVRLAQRTFTAAAVKENIGLTGIAKNPNARQELLTKYTAFQDRLNMSDLPADHPYRRTINEYLQSAVQILRSETPERLVDETGMQFEELVLEVDTERELMEAMETETEHVK